MNRRHSTTRSRLLAGLAAVSALAATSVVVADASPAAPAGVAPAVDAGSTLRDRVIHSEVAAARAERARRFRSYPDGDGHTVRIDDGIYTIQDARETALFLGTLAHGEEMNRLNVRLVHPRLEMPRICGSGVLACYFPGDELMVISGQETGGRPSRDFVIAHEYGHHLATNRRNSPWPAIDWGTKRWATHDRVCAGVRRGRYEPGAFSRTGYYRNPGEAFAEAFAFYHYPDHIPWEWNSGLRPDQGAYRAIAHDVREPWAGRRSVRFDGRLSARERRARKGVRAPLDGRINVELDGPRRADFDLRLLSRKGRRLKASRRRRADESLGYTVCGRHRFKVQVLRRSGRGRFEVEIRKP